MKKYLFTGAVILACICIIISVAYACVSLDVDSDYAVYVKVGNTAYIDAWVYAGGPVYNPGGWIWTWPAAFGSHQQSDTDYDSTSWSTCYTTGIYDINMDGYGPNGHDSDHTKVYVINLEIEDNPPNRDTPEYIAYQTGMNVYYKIEPTSGWTADEVRLYIKDSSSEIIKYVPLSTALGEQTAYWDGKNARGQWAEPGQYTAQIRVRKYATYIWSDTHTFYVQSVQNVQIIVVIEDPKVNDVCSGLNQYTGSLVFELNGTVIPNSNLSLQQTYEYDDGDPNPILTNLQITYCPSASELIIPGENVVKIDIDDIVDNHMDQVVQTFQLPLN